MTDADLVTALEQSKDPFMRALALLASMRRRKAADYNAESVKLEDYFPFGRLSYAQMCWIKALRMRVLAERLPSAWVHNESFADSALDLANYAVFCLMAEKSK